MLGGFLIMGGLGIFVGVGLALASKIFYVYVDPKIEAVEEALPGANCGGCGLPGCSANAVAVVAGQAAATSCVAGGPEVAEQIAAIMGVKIEAKEPDIARPGCTYGFQDADLKYLYDGVRDCRAAALLSGGTKVCPIGCLGLGTCARACPFDALSMGPDNLPVVNLERCTGCGTCERICPKDIITLSSNTRRFQGEYTTDECTAPCQRACPAGIEIPVYIKQVKEGDYLGAVRTIKETNPFPLVCGRVCVHPCEYECRRNLVDEPVAINYLKRFASDYEMTSGQRVQVPRAPESGLSVAVVGGGAEGLTAAYFLNRLGHEAAVYEASSQLGGLLRSGIQENRLPRDVLDYEIGGILEAGVQAKTNQKLGKDFTLESLLKEGNAAVLIAIGGWDSQLSERVEAGKPVQVLPGFMLLIDFIMYQRAGNCPAIGNHVMILGGGNAALEAAFTCLKTGAESVDIVFRGSPNKTQIPKDELKKAEDQGIRLHFNSALTRMMGEDSKLTHVEIARISEEQELTEDGEKQTLPVDILLTGAGRFPELIYVPRRGEGEEESEPGKGHLLWETLPPYASPYADNDIGIFRPGEVTGDYKAVVEAIGAGRRAASSVNHFLNGEPLKAPDHMIRKYTEVLNVIELEPVPKSTRQEMPAREQELQISDPSAEIELGYSDSQAIKEADRCLQCGLICYRRVSGDLH